MPDWRRTFYYYLLKDHYKGDNLIEIVMINERATSLTIMHPLFWNANEVLYLVLIQCYRCAAEIIFLLSNNAKIQRLFRLVILIKICLPLYTLQKYSKCQTYTQIVRVGPENNFYYLTKKLRKPKKLSRCLIFYWQHICCFLKGVSQQQWTHPDGQHCL